LAWDDSSPLESGFDLSSSSNLDRKSENSSSMGHPHTANGSSYAHSEDGSVKSAPGSPRSRSMPGSPQREISTVKETRSNDHRTTSSNSGDPFGDGGSWEAAFVDENDSLWGNDKSAVDANKNSSDLSSSALTFDGGRERQLDNPKFDSVDSFQLKSLKITSFDTEEGDNENYDTFGPLRTREKSLFSFSDNNSIPSTPLVNTGSPGRFSNAGSMDDHNSHFDSFPKFDSFSVRDSGLFSSHDAFSRSDSISSFKDAGHSRGFTSFDDTDPFASAGPFSLGGQTPRRTSDGWSAF